MKGSLPKPQSPRTKVGCCFGVKASKTSIKPGRDDAELLSFPEVTTASKTIAEQLPSVSRWQTFIDYVITRFIRQPPFWQRNKRLEFLGN